MTKKIYLTMLVCAGCIASANAQFGKLKGLVKKDKTEEPRSEKNDGAASGDDTPETSTANVTANPQAWATELDKDINWFKLNPTGKLIAAASDGVYGIDPASGKTLWKLADFKDIGKENFIAIPNSPYAAMILGGQLSFYHVIVDVTDGRIVADTKSLGMKYVGKRYVVPSLGGILFAGYMDNAQSLVLIDAATGKKLWALQNLFENKNEYIVSRPLAIDDQNFMIATTNRIYKINTKSGSVAWKANFTTPTDKTLITEPPAQPQDKESTKFDEQKKDKFGGLGTLGKSNGMGNAINQMMDLTYGRFILADQNPGTVYYYTNQGMAAFNLTSGAAAWPAVKFGDPIADFIPDERGFLIATHDKNSELMLIDHKTGQQKWSPVKLSGNVTSIKLNGEKLAVASAKEDGNNSVNIVNINTGKPLAASALKVSGQVQDIRMTDKGMIYRTTKETNIQDINSGKDLWPSSLTYKEGTALGIDKGDKTYIWASNKLYVVNQLDGQYKELGSGVRFGGDETAKNIEIRENGILVSADQNVALFDWDGNKVYHVYQKAPGISTFGKIMAVAVMSASLAQNAAHGAQAGYSGISTSTGQSHMAAADRWTNLGSAAANDMGRRFKASQSAGSYQVILTKLSTGGDSGIGLVRVNKDTGKIEAKVLIDDKKPDYIADEVDNLIFYKASGNKLIGYHL